MKTALFPKVILGVFVSFAVSLIWSPDKPCRADDIYTIVVKKNEEKQKTRWNLADWLATRDRMRMMDLWLALHSAAPYEFFLAGNYQFNQHVTGGTFNAWEMSGAAFVTIFGLEGKYESSLDNRWSAIFDFRVMGFHDQSTNITLQGGLSGRSGNNGTFRNPLAGVSLTIYLAKAFGIQGLYRHFFPSVPSLQGVSVTGDRFQGGAFLEYKFLRIYADYFLESDNLSAANGTTIGTKFYF